MQIFFLDEDPVKTASYFCDKHATKMGLEAVQILCTVAWKKKPNLDDRFYKPTHSTGPFAKWVSQSLANWNWTKTHARAVFGEYTARYNKNHKSLQVLEMLECLDLRFQSEELTTFPKVVSEQFLNIQNPIEAYRKYYISKQHEMQMRWKPPSVRPFWFVVETD